MTLAELSRRSTRRNYRPPNPEPDPVLYGECSRCGELDPLCPDPTAPDWLVCEGCCRAIVADERYKARRAANSAD